MDAEWLKWYLALKPFRRFRLATKGGIEHAVERPEEVDLDIGGTTYRLYNVVRAGLKTYRGTYNVSDIDEIRQ